MRLETDLPPDVGELARRLRGRPGLAVLRSDPRGAIGHGDAGSSFVAVEPVDVTESLAPTAADLDTGWSGLPAAPRWIGYVPYEAFRGFERLKYVPHDSRPLADEVRPRWHRYDAVARIDHGSGRVVIEADDVRAARALVDRFAVGDPSRNETFHLGEPTSHADEAHTQAVRRARELIAAGDVYQVNLARKFVASFQGDTLEFFERLFEGAPAPFGFHFDAGDHVVTGASPELALELRGRALRTGPIKGTRLRGADAHADALAAAELDASEKERAELTMAIDLHRNDLGRVAKPGSVRVMGPPRLRPGATVWSRVAEVRAELEDGVGLESVLRAVLPCGSVTGAPKVRAMEIVSELERDRRGLYTGAYGYVGRDGGLVLAVAIRTAVVRAGVATYFAGGGIVWGSDPERETEETRWKARQLFRLAPENLAARSSFR